MSTDLYGNTEVSTVLRQNSQMVIAAEIRAEAGRQLRDAILDAAYTSAAAAGWHSVRVAAVAADVGVSRQTVHKEFGTKDALGQALVLREADRFIGEAMAGLQASHGDPAHALRTAIIVSLQRLAVHPLLVSVRSDERGPLLPQLTTRGHPVRQRAVDALTAWTLDCGLSADHERASAASDSLVRLVISHAVMPAEEAEVVGPRLAGQFCAVLQAP